MIDVMRSGHKAEPSDTNMRATPSSVLDPRAWNLFVGAAMLAGCSARPLTDEGETSGATDEEIGSQGSDTDTTNTSDTTDADGDEYYGECRTDADCGPYICRLGVCEPECLYEYDCQNFELCSAKECVAIGEPPPSCEFERFEIPIIHTLNSPALALTFTDVDADGQDELVVATATDLLVYESGSDVPTVSARAVTSYAPTRMVAGDFDNQPGEDVTLLIEGEYHRYFSDGVASLVTPILEPSALPSASGLLAGDFDGQAPDDLVVWSYRGAVLELTSTTVPLAHVMVNDVAAFEYGSPGAGLVIVRDGEAALFDLMGGHHRSVSSASGVASLTAPGQPSHVIVRWHSAAFSEWSELEVRGATDFEWKSTILLGSEPDVVAGDFDGDQHEELFAMYGESARVIFDLFGEPCIATQFFGDLVGAVDVGDHDGDGDDEVALLSDDVMIVDVE